MQSPLPVFALLFNAFVWGLAWWPFRVMHGAGLHPLWTTAAMYCVVLLGMLALRPGIWAQVRQYPELWLLALVVAARRPKCSTGLRPGLMQHNEAGSASA